MVDRRAPRGGPDAGPEAALHARAVPLAEGPAAHWRQARDRHGLVGWRQARDRRGLAWWRALGPGLVLAVAGIGSSHFLLAPTAGALFGYALAWTIVVGHLVKYPAFLYATTYAAATGDHLVNAFARLPGPRRWAAWTLLAGLAAQAAFVAAGVTLVAVGVVRILWPGVGPATVGVILIGLAGTLQWTGRMRGLERFSAVALVGIALTTVVATVAAKPDVGALAAASFLPRNPVGSGLLVGALLGFMPAPLEIAVMKSLWNAQGTQAEGGPRVRMRAARLDLDIGYAASLLLGLLLLALGAAVVHPVGLSGGNVLADIAAGFTSTLGSWALPIIIVGGFLGMFSTMHAVLDGYPRALSAGLTAVGLPRSSTRAGRDPLQWWTMYGVSLGAVGTMVWLPDPVAVVSAVATATVLAAPLWFLLIVWTVHREDTPARPGTAMRMAAWAGVAAMAAVAGLVAWQNL